MKFNNHWLGEVEQAVTVHLKKQVLRYTQSGQIKDSIDALTGKKATLGCYEELRNVEADKPRSMTVMVPRYGLTLQDKLRIVTAAALKEFRDDVNHFVESRLDDIVYRGTTSTPDTVIEEKFLKNLPRFPSMDSMPQNLGEPFIPVDELPPSTTSMWEVQQWVKKKQTMLASTAEVK